MVDLPKLNLDEEVDKIRGRETTQNVTQMITSDKFQFLNNLYE